MRNHTAHLQDLTGDSSSLLPFLQPQGQHPQLLILWIISPPQTILAAMCEQNYTQLHMPMVTPQMEGIQDSGHSLTAAQWHLGAQEKLKPFRSWRELQR